MEYTKGEWEALYALSDNSFHVMSKGIEGDMSINVARMATRPEAEANTHLIAASPDMYAALRKIVTMGFSHLSQDDIDKAKQAVDKAESKG